MQQQGERNDLLAQVLKRAEGAQLLVEINLVSIPRGRDQVLS